MDWAGKAGSGGASAILSDHLVLEAGGRAVLPLGELLVQPAVGDFAERLRPRIESIQQLADCKLTHAYAP
jgi:hypothetical protein